MLNPIGQPNQRSRSCRERSSQQAGRASWCLLALVGASTGISTIAHACNGDPELCDRPYDEVVYLTTHNAHSNTDYGFTIPLPNQPRNVIWQLENGVRALMLDTYLHLGRAYLCHGVCGPWGKKKLRPVLEEIRLFLEANPAEVLTLILESYLSEERTEAAFSDAGLLPFLYAHDGGSDWPTLRELLTAGTPLVVFTDDSSATLGWHHYVWDYAWELPFDYGDVGEFTCEDGRGSPGADLFIFNHWITTALGSDREGAPHVNRYSLLHNRAVECWGHSGWNPQDHIPNFLSLDHFDLGAGAAVVRSLNESWPESPLWLDAGELIRGHPASLQVSGLEPGARVYFGAGLAGQGIGDSIPQLGGLRLDLLGSVIPLGSAQADAQGIATLVRTVPEGIGADSVATQAALPRPGERGQKSIAVDSGIEDAR